METEHNQKSRRMFKIERDTIWSYFIDDVMSGPTNPPPCHAAHFFSPIFFVIVNFVCMVMS
jgi:hypothetical protein